MSVELRVEYRIQPDHVNRGQTKAYRQPSTRDVVAWLVEHGAYELETHDRGVAGVPIMWPRNPGRYLVFRMDEQ